MVCDEEMVDAIEILREFVKEAGSSRETGGGPLVLRCCAFERGVCEGDWLTSLIVSTVCR